MATALREKEANGVRHVCCPNCSKMYAAEEKGQSVETPSKCKRCGSPMDPDKARDFAEKQAAATHQPLLTQMGERMRTMNHPPADRQVKGAVTK